MNERASTAAAAPDLPRWDLSDLFPGPQSPELAAALGRAAEEAKAFAGANRGRLQDLQGTALGQAVARYEELQDLTGRIASYTQLLYAGDMSDPEIARFYQTIQERLTDISSDLLFFTLELNRLDDAALQKRLQAKELAHYAPWLRDIRAFRAHQLSDELEKLLHEKQVAGRAAWNRLFDETIAALRFPVDGKELTSSDALNLLTDRDAKTRRKAALALSEVLARNIRLFALVTNTLAKDKEIEDRWRGFPRPVSARNLANFVEDKVVEALVGAVRAAYPRLSHRYYALKAKWMGKERLDWWDRNAPLPQDEDNHGPAVCDISAFEVL